MLTSIRLSNFRNHGFFSIDSCGKKVVVICGQNGSGKTSVLEAISLFAPGKGLRAATLEEITRTDVLFSNARGNHQQHHSKRELLPPLSHSAQAIAGDKAWQAKLECNLTDQQEMHALKCTYHGNKKIVELDGTVTKKINEISRVIRPIWLVPQMNGVLSGDASARRQLFDRYIHSLMPQHGEDYLSYQHHLRSRLVVLRDIHDHNWVRTLELHLSYEAIRVAARRLTVIRELNDASRTASVAEEGQPFAEVKVEGEIEKMIDKEYRDLAHVIGTGDKEQIPGALLDKVTRRWFEQRQQDTITKRSSFGVHRSDFVVYDGATGRLAKHCSTGEQKFLLFFLIMLQAETISIRAHGAITVLLLDDVMAYLDKDRQRNILQRLSALPVQAWITTADFQLIYDAEQALGCDGFVKVIL